MSPAGLHGTTAAASQPSPARRAIIKGAAWSAPVIAAAMAAPAASASVNEAFVAVTGTTPLSVFPVLGTSRSITAANNLSVSMPTMLTIFGGSSGLRNRLRIYARVNRNYMTPGFTLGKIGRGFYVDTINGLPVPKYRNPSFTYPMIGPNSYNYPNTTHQAEEMHVNLQPNETLSLPLTYALLGSSSGNLPPSDLEFRLNIKITIGVSGGAPMYDIGTGQDITIPAGSNILQAI